MGYVEDVIKQGDVYMATVEKGQLQFPNINFIKIFMSVKWS